MDSLTVHDELGHKENYVRLFQRSVVWVHRRWCCTNFSKVWWRSQSNIDEMWRVRLSASIAAVDQLMSESAAESHLFDLRSALSRSVASCVDHWKWSGGHEKTMRALFFFRFLDCSKFRFKKFFFLWIANKEQYF